MKLTIFSYAGLVLALGACMFSVKSHDAHHRNDVRALAPSTDVAKLDDIFTISPEDNKNWVDVEHGVIINYVVKNNTGQSLTDHMVLNIPGYVFSVTDDKHKEVPLTRYGNLLLKQETVPSGAGFVSIHGTILAPGEEEANKMLLSQFYDMSVPGKYFITASKTVVIGGKNRLITSNTLEIEVEPYDQGRPSYKDIEYLSKQQEKQVEEQYKKNDETNSHQ